MRIVKVFFICIDVDDENGTKHLSTWFDVDTWKHMLLVLLLFFSQLKCFNFFSSSLISFFLLMLTKISDDHCHWKRKFYDFIFLSKMMFWLCRLVKERERERANTIEMWCAWIVIFTYVNLTECVCVWRTRKNTHSIQWFLLRFRYKLHGSFDWFALNQNRYSYRG